MVVVIFLLLLLLLLLLFLFFVSCIYWTHVLPSPSLPPPHLLQIGNALRCPASKFITHTLSHVCFLILLAAATFRLEDKTFPIKVQDLKEGRFEDLTHEEKVESLLKVNFRPANTLMTNVQICLMFWVLGKSPGLVDSLFAEMFPKYIISVFPHDRS